jgi:hypothetical protein
MWWFASGSHRHTPCTECTGLTVTDKPILGRDTPRTECKPWTSRQLLGGRCVEDAPPMKRKLAEYIYTPYIDNGVLRSAYSPKYPDMGIRPIHSLHGVFLVSQIYINSSENLVYLFISEY